MQLEFQVIKDGHVLFKSSVAETLRNRLPEITSRALNRFPVTCIGIIFLTYTDPSRQFEIIFACCSCITWLTGPFGSAYGV